MSKNSQMIGRRGERRFQTLCSDAHVTCNVSTEDDYGWDNIIEFPPRRIPFAALDMQPPPTIAAVQVKATESTSLSVGIKLSNALIYARSTVPQFIVLVALGGDAPRYYARHVWTPLIAAWLKAGREADAIGLADINRREVTLTFSPEDERQEDLLAWIEAEIQAVETPYAATKKLIVDTVGFEQGYGTARLTLALDGPQHFLDLQLGLSHAIKAERFVFHNERFGIQAREPEIDLEEVMLEFIPEGQDCIVCFEFPTGVTVVTDARFYSAELGNERAFRIASGPIDLVYGPSARVKATANLNIDDQLSLEDLRAFAHCMATPSDRPVNVQLRINGKHFEVGAITLQKDSIDQHGWNTLATSTDLLRSMVEHAGTSMPQVTISELNQVAGLLECLLAVASERMIRVDYTPYDGENIQVDGFLAYSSVVIGSTAYSGVGHRLVVSDRTSRGRRQLAFGPARLLWAEISDVENWSADAVQSAYQRQLDRLSAEGQLLALGDLEKHLTQDARERELASDLPTGRAKPLLMQRRRRRPRRITSPNS